MAVLCVAVVLGLAAPSASAQQQTNPVDRKVENPITDTPSVNPLSQDQPPIRPRPRRTPQPQGATASGAQASDELEVRADHDEVSGPEGARVFIYTGNVDARIGIFRLQADKVTVYTAKNRVVAEGNVVFDQGEFQRITGSRAEWNYATKTGFFENSTGFTNQTQDGTIMYFTADHVEKVSGDKIVITNGEVTACGDDERPKWSFKTKRATIKLADRVRLKHPRLLVKGIPVFYLPYASISIKPRARASGFLTPTFSGSGQKGLRFSSGYYQTLGRSADITFRNDIYTKRGLGFGADLRTRANSRSYLNMGFYTVKDRVFGPKKDDAHPDQGGSSFYVDGVHYFPNGFLAAADINITSNLAFRQIFSDSIQLAISPEERSQVFVNKNFGAYSFNFIASTQVISIPTERIRTRQLPGISVDKRPTLVSWLKDKLPVYFSFESSVAGMSRKETIEDAATLALDGIINPIITPSIVQRLDFSPRVELPLNFDGWNVTAAARVRGTFYSNSVDPLTRLVIPQNISRLYGEFTLDVRPPALARNFHHRDGTFSFRHVIEPYLTYRKVGGLSDFESVIRFDELDAVADTNELEYGVTNRFFLRRSAESVGGRPRAKTAAEKRREGGKTGETTNESEDKSPTGVPKNTRERRAHGLAASIAADSAALRVPVGHGTPEVFLRPELRRRAHPRPSQSVLPDQHFLGLHLRRRASTFLAHERRGASPHADLRRERAFRGRTHRLRHLGRRRRPARPRYLIRHAQARGLAPRGRGLPDLLLHARRHARAVARALQRPLRQGAGHAARFAVEPFGLHRRPRARALRRRVLLLRLPEPAGQGQLVAHKLDRHGRSLLGLLRGHGAVLHLQRRAPQREPLRLQLPPQRHRHLRHGADRPTLPLTDFGLRVSDCGLEEAAFRQRGLHQRTIDEGRAALNPQSETRNPKSRWGCDRLLELHARVEGLAS